MAVERYTPTFAAQAFKQVRDTDSNDEYEAVQSALNGVDAWTLATSSQDIDATDPNGRNILVDCSSVIDTGNAIVITLPASPAVGDPPCRVSLLTDAYCTIGAPFTHSAVYVQGDHSDLIMGSSVCLPRMYNAGDCMEFVWVGGGVGWIISNCTIGAYASNDSFTNDGPNGSDAEKYAAPYFDAIYNSFALSPAVQLQFPPQGRGQWCAFSFDSGMLVQVGTSNDTVNGVAGPVDFLTANTRHVVTNLGSNGPGFFFSVTT